MIKHIKEEEFETEVLKSKEPVIVDFFATWCGPCKMLSPILEQAAKEIEGKAKVIKIDIDDAENLTKKFGILSVPTMVIIADGKEQEKLVGLRQKQQILDAINKHI